VIVDYTCAIVAIVFAEPERAVFVQAIERAERALISTVYKAAQQRLDSPVTRMHHLSATTSGETMRTTFTLDDDAAELARTYAKARSLRLGQAVSELIRRASAPPMTLKKKGQAWVFELPPDAPPVTAAQVKALLDESP
jgi:uncharacterized protein with PIN domain